MVIARFIPFVRTIVPMLAGAGRMPQRTFLTANVIGAALWAVGISLLGFFLGKQIGEDNIDKYLCRSSRVIIVLSLIPPFLEYRKHKRASALRDTGHRSVTTRATARPSRRRPTANVAPPRFENRIAPIEHDERDARDDEAHVVVRAG